MTHSGMTPIVKSVARLVTGFAAVFGIYVAVTGHLGPGGGFAGGVVLAAAAILAVLAFGRTESQKLLTESRCHVWDAAAAAAFLLVAFLGFFEGSFFVNFIQAIYRGQLHSLVSAGTIPVSNLAICVKVAAGLAGVFVALSAFRRARMERESLDG